MASVFLSYDHEDIAVARPLAVALEKAGHTVWYDRDIHGGAQYSRKIEQALDAADAVIVLWSPNSLDSAWVRDEAAEGRDRGKLVPLSIGGVNAPMGFRQFQTIDLGAWKGRGKVPRLDALLNAVHNQSGPAENEVTSRKVTRAETAPARPQRKTIAAVIAAAIILLMGAGGAWVWLGRNSLPVVEVAAANNSSRSQAAASDLFVKLGSLAEVGQGKWQLVDAASAPPKPDLIFRTADLGSADRAQANLVLLDGENSGLLWSREFDLPKGREADLRQQLSLTAGRVLACALESREAGGLPRDLLKLFLNACSIIAETSFDEPTKVSSQLRTIVSAKPRFAPAWGRLIWADMGAVDVARLAGDVPAATKTLRADMAKARKIHPDLPELTLVEIKFLPPTAYGQRLQLFEKAAAKAPQKAEIFADQGGTLQQVGRMNDAINAARRVAELDPLSPAATTQLIMTLAYAGQFENARTELARAERVWAGTGALRDALWSFHLRYGDPNIARKYGGDLGGLALYLDARFDPSPSNVEKFLTQVRKFQGRSGNTVFGMSIQGLAEFNRTDELHEWIKRTPSNVVAGSSYLMFRPAFAAFRRDPRFMTVAKRIGLIDYWRSSGNWPDYCAEPDLPYDCKAEAAKYD